MNKISLFGILLLAITACGSPFGEEAKEVYTYEVDLKNLVNDRATVTMKVRNFTPDTARFVLAAYMPGVYQPLEFGRVVHNLKAFSPEGDSMEVLQVNSHRWEIPVRGSSFVISYELNDMDGALAGLSRRDAAENIFNRGKGMLFNPAASLGYLDNGRADTIHVSIQKPFGLSLSVDSGTAALSESEVFYYSVQSLKELFGRPLLLSNNRKQSFKVRETDLNFAWYAEDDSFDGAFLSKPLKKAFGTVRDYMDYTVPVNRYSFLFYIRNEEGGERVVSDFESASVWVLPELKAGEEETQTFLYEQALNELFHIYSPQNIQSREYQAFDFDSPRGSEHLWLAEGGTAYLALHAQVNQRVISEQEFQERLEQVIQKAWTSTPDSSLSKLSNNALTSGHKEIAEILRARGFLVSMYLDLELRAHSFGQQGFKHLIRYMSRAFKGERSFSDAELFEIFSSFANEDFTPIYEDHIKGTEPVPVQALFKKAGYIIDPGTYEISKEPYPGQDEIEMRLNWLYGR